MPSFLEVYTQMYRLLQRAQWYVMGSVAQCLLSSHSGEHILLEGPQRMDDVWKDVNMIDAGFLDTQMDGFDLSSLPSRDDDLKANIIMEEGYIAKMVVASVKSRVLDLVGEARVLRVALAGVLVGDGGGGNMEVHESLQGAVNAELWLENLEGRMKRCARHPIF